MQRSRNILTSSTNLRPQSLDELIGQENLKQKARIAVGAALQRGEPLPHCLLTSSGGGLGKTTLAGVLANEMFRPLVSTTGQCLLTPVDLRNTLISLKPGSLLLVDEFHALGRAAAEELLLVLEDGVLNINLESRQGPIRIPVPPFTLIAATTRPSAIAAPMFQRFGLHFHFDFYSVTELCEIAGAFAREMPVEFAEAVNTALAGRSLGIPRRCLRLIERVRDVAQAKGLKKATLDEMSLAMRIEGIDHLGLRRDERELLQTLADAEPRAVSARSLALALGVEIATVIEVLEPPLVRLGLLTIGRGGRRLTAKGMEHLRTVERQESA